MKTPETTALLQQNEKVIMVVGATGTGKSTLINRMINYIADVKYTDVFRFQLVIENNVSQTESQTKIITKYVLRGSTFDYKLSIIDTPGFGDTKGEEEDRKTTEKIQSLFQSGTIVSLDAICFVTKYGNVRLTDFERNVFKNVTNIFGDDVGPNVFVMTTYCDDTYDKDDKIDPAPVLKAFDKLQIPYHISRCFPFNNKNIYKKPVERKGLNDYWETSTKSFEFFFKQLKDTDPVSLKLTKDVLMTQHEIIQVRMPKLVRCLKTSIHQIDENRELTKKLENLKEFPENLDFTFTISETKEEMVPIEEIGVFSIICTKCPSKVMQVCHYPCDVSEDKPIKKCSMFSSKWFTKDICKACPNNCPWIYHERSKKKLKFVTKSVTQTKEDLKQKYMGQIKGQEVKVENLIKACEEKMISSFGKLLNILKETQKDIDFLNNKCLSKDPTSLEDHIEHIIKQEMKTKEDGYDKRIAFLNDLVSSMKNLISACI